MKKLNTTQKKSRRLPRNILLITACLIIAFVGIGMVVMYNAGARIIDEMISADLRQAIAEATALTDLEGITGEPADTQLPATGTDPNAPPDAATNPPATTDDPAIDMPGTATDLPATAPGSTTTPTKPVAPAVPTLPKTPAELEAEAKAIEEKITASDKIRAAQLVWKRLSSEDINTLTALAKDGFTAEEKQQALALAYSRFSAEEIEEIKQLYQKYYVN